MPKKLLYILSHFPQLSESYINTELDRVSGDHEIFITSLSEPDLPGGSELPFTRIRNPDHLMCLVDQTKPDLIHSHWLSIVSVVVRAAREKELPFTIRSHSFDTFDFLKKMQKTDCSKKRRILDTLSSELCRGILVFPFFVDQLVALGIPENKIIPCFPVVDVGLFRYRGKNGNEIMNTGACLPKKKMEDFVDLAAITPHRKFVLYPMGYGTEKIHSYNARHNSPIRIEGYRSLRQMPAIYQRSQWLVYTACPRLKTVGWPMAVAEAQASGVGVVMPRLREDLQYYLGDAGYFYDTLDEAVEIVSSEFPQEKRKLGYHLAERCDIDGHISKLLQLWNS